MEVIKKGNTEQLIKHMNTVDLTGSIKFTYKKKKKKKYVVVQNGC